MDDFRAEVIDTGETTIFIRRAGSGPPLLLLHGFPETHLMWRGVAPLLARHFTVVCGPYTKRAMANDMLAVTARLGFSRFALAGHDRGGRVAYRLALDHPERVERVAVLDVLPTETVWERADARLALAFWPWSLLAQAEPLPESLLAAAPQAFVDAALGGWGTEPSVFPAEVRNAYAEALRDPARAHAICEEYRAAASVDREHDRADRAAGRRITSPLLALWSAGGPLDAWYADAGGPLALWRAWSDDVQGYAVEGGHFFPEQAPEQTAEALRRFFQSQTGARQPRDAAA